MGWGTGKLLKWHCFYSLFTQTKLSVAEPRNHHLKRHFRRNPRSKFSSPAFGVHGKYQELCLLYRDYLAKLPGLMQNNKFS